MNKISKLLVMALVVLAVITMSIKVSAATNKQDLIDYVSKSHNINGMVFELKGSNKTNVVKHLEGVSEEAAKSALAKIKEAEKIVKDSGVTKIEDLSSADQKKLREKAQDAATAVGLTLKLDSNKKTFTLTDKNGKSIASGSTSNVVSYSKSSNSSSDSKTDSSAGKSYLYTGTTYVAFSAIVLAIVAVAVVVKKRA